MKIRNINKIIVGLLLIFAIIFTGCSQNNYDDNNRDTLTDVNSIMQKEEGNKSDLQISQEKLLNIISDGLYNESIDYESPGGFDKVNLNLEIKENKVISVNLESVKVSEISKNFIDNFNREIQKEIIGKSLSDIKMPSVISGASLTTKAFNSKIEELKLR